MTRYELLERIGVGGMAEIFRGKAVAGSGFQKDVAIKRILPHLSQDSRFVELLITEAKTLSELRHRNIVQIYDVGLNDDGQYFLVMEFVDGLDLADLFDAYEHKRARPPLDVCLYIGAEVCEALDHAHAARDADGNLVGLVHRDVSPSNILLSRSGEVKLTDFGIAKRMEEMTGHGGVRGKFAYISPEQANNQHVDGRSDVCSLGMVLFEMISGERLFSALPDFDALKMVRGHQIPELGSVATDVDPGLEAVIMKAVAPDPADRYQSASEFAAALRDYRYSMVSSSGDPAQSVAGIVQNLLPTEPAEATDGDGARDEPPDLPELADPDRTIVRIRSAAGFGPSRFDDADADAFGGARALLDSYDDDEKTVAAADLPMTEVRPRVDPDADTELAMLRGSDDGGDNSDDADFDGELETKLFDRNDPIIAAAIAGQAARTRRKPPPPRGSVPAEAPTVPRSNPVVVAEQAPPPPPPPAPAVASSPAIPARAVAAVAPRYPRASPEALRQIDHPSMRTILGLPRKKALWIFGIAGGVLLLLVIALAGSGGASSSQGPAAIDGGIIEIYDAGSIEPDAAPAKTKKKRRKKRRRR